MLSVTSWFWLLYGFVLGFVLRCSLLYRMKKDEGCVVKSEVLVVKPEPVKVVGERVLDYDDLRSEPEVKRKVVVESQESEPVVKRNNYDEYY